MKVKRLIDQQKAGPAHWCDRPHIILCLDFAGKEIQAYIDRIPPQQRPQAAEMMRMFIRAAAAQPQAVDCLVKNCEGHQHDTLT